MRNTLKDLNNHLFAEIERLSDEDLKGEELYEEIERARAISSVATQIISNGELVVKAKKAFDDVNNSDMKLPAMLEG